MTAKNDYREFNLEHAKKGAPLKLRSGMPARILATDIKKDMGYEIAVVVQDTPRGREYVVTRTIDGSFSSAGISSNDLVMAPVFYIGETPIYFGDKVEYSSCIERIWSRFEIDETFDPNVGYIRLPLNSIQYKGRELTLESEIWHNPNTPGPDNHIMWKKIHIKERFYNMDEVKECLVRNYSLYHMHYEWEPAVAYLHGKECTRMSVLWYKTPNNTWVKVNANDCISFSTTHFERILTNSEAHQFYSWTEPPKPVYKEVWQAVFKNGRGKRYGGTIYSSKSECETRHSKAESFLYAEQTNGYWE